MTSFKKVIARENISLGIIEQDLEVIEANTIDPDPQDTWKRQHQTSEMLRHRRA